VDDITAPFTTCKLHIQEGNATVIMATDVVSPIDPTKTPRIHTTVIPLEYASVSVDRVVKGYSNVPLDIEGCDGEKTLGEAEKVFICWRKRYIVIPAASTPPPQQQPNLGADESERNFFSTNYVLDSIMVYSYIPR
jgi:hypothetical protein